MLEENQVLSNIFKNVYPNWMQYESDVPQNFKRPCFLFLNPDANEDTEIMSAFAYKSTKNYTVYAFVHNENEAKESHIDRIDLLSKVKVDILEYVAGAIKYPIPNSDRRFMTVERVSATANEPSGFVQFSFRLSRILSRDLRRPVVPKIMHVYNEAGILKEDEISGQK